MDTFGLKIIASDKVFYEGRCRKLIIPAPDGEKGILPNHENMVIAIAVGTAKVNTRSSVEEWKDLAVGTGFAEIVNNRVTLLVDTAERPEDIDVRRAREQQERAEEQMRQKQSTQEYYHTQASPRPGNDPSESSPGQEVEHIATTQPWQENCAKSCLHEFLHSFFHGMSARI